MGVRPARRYWDNRDSCEIWNAVPRKPRRQAANKAEHATAIRLALRDRGLPRAPVRISDVQQVDIEGDGKDEYLITAANMDPSRYRVGDYSAIALRRFVKGRLRTYIVIGDFHVKDDGRGVPRYCQLTGLYDLDGDGHLEIVVDYTIPLLESWATEVYKVVDGKIRLVAAVRPNCDYRIR